MYKRVVYAAIIVLAVGIAILISIITANRDNSPVVAEVDGYQLTQLALEQYASDLGMDASYLSPESRESIINSWINYTILYNEGKDKHVTRVKSFRKELKRKSERYKRELIGQAALKVLLEGKLDVTQDEITAYYEKNKETFKVDKAMVWLKVIYCGTKENAEKVMGQLKTGMTFEELAEQNKPEGEPFISNLGYVPIDGIQDSLKEAIIGAKINDIIPPVRVELTEDTSVYYVWKVMDKIFANDYMKIDAAGSVISRELEKMKIQAYASEEILKLREKHKIVFHTKDIK